MLSYRLHVSRAGYFMSVTNGGRIVTWAADREADTQQAQVFHSLLAERRAELCDRLDEQAIKLARYEQSRDSAGARRKRGRIREIRAEIRDIDRMMQGLRVTPGCRAQAELGIAAVARHPAWDGGPTAYLTMPGPPDTYRSRATRCDPLQRLRFLVRSFGGDVVAIGE